MPPPTLSVLDAANDAIQLVRQRLFPVRFEVWVALGFLAFLDSCGRSSGSLPGFGGGNAGRGRGSGNGSGAESAAAVRDWVLEHLLLLGALALVLLTLLVALIAVVTWISSRGTFMYLDNVARGSYDIVRPWREHRERAWSYFGWSFSLSLGLLALVMALLGVGGYLVYLLFLPGSKVVPVVGLITVFLLVIAAAFLGGMFSLLLRDFVAPLQVVLDLPCGRALGVAWTLVRENPGTFVAYVALKLVFAVTLGTLSVAAGCLTCCIGFLPVLSQTLLQPLHYFERAWSLLLLRQAGYDLFQ